jgi:hypothetical protein
MMRGPEVIAPWSQGDLVAAGLVNSLAKLGGNITGSQLLGDELVAKRLQFLKALVPNLSRVALLREDVTTSAIPEIAARYDQQTVSAARALGLTVQMFNVHGAKDLAAAFSEMIKNQIRGALVASSAFMFVHRQALVDLAAAHRIAAIYEVELFVEIGGLMSYGRRRSRDAAPCRCLRRQDPQKCEARRSPDRTANEVQPRPQREERQSPWADDSPIPAAAGGSGHRVTRGLAIAIALSFNMKTANERLEVLLEVPTVCVASDRAL